MPRLAEINTKGFQLIDIPSPPWLNQALSGGLVRGAVYLLTGPPGVGVEVIAIDSVQGRGLSSNATRKYGALYEFLDMASV